MDGEHTIERCRQVTEEVLRAVFNQLYKQKVVLDCMILKPNMVLPGLTCPEQDQWTKSPSLQSGVFCKPCLLPFRQSPSCLADNHVNWPARLNAMNLIFKSQLPWALAFSFARAIQQPALTIWQGKEANVLAAQQALYHRAKCNQAARRGQYDAAIENICMNNKYRLAQES